MAGISVIVTVYNVESYLEQCVRSITAQSHEDLQIILVDDGSTDKSGEICDALARADGRIEVIHKQNGGVRSATIAGIAAAKKEYCGFVDSDDYIKEDMYKRLLEALESQRAQCACCRITHFGAGAGDYTPRKPAAVYDKNEVEELILRPFFEQNRHFNTLWSDSKCDKLFITERLRRIVPALDLKVRHREDYDFNILYLAECDKIVMLGESLYLYRRRSDSFTRSYTGDFIPNCVYSMGVLRRLASAEGRLGAGLPQLYKDDLKSAVGLVRHADMPFGRKLADIADILAAQKAGWETGAPPPPGKGRLGALATLCFEWIKEYITRAAVWAYHLLTGYKPQYSGSEGARE